MADHFIGTNRGLELLSEKSWTYGTSTGSTDLEIRIGDAFGWTRQEIYDALVAAADRIVQNDSPAAASLFPII
jgi:hypothetical protein